VVLSLPLSIRNSWIIYKFYQVCSKSSKVIKSKTFRSCLCLRSCRWMFRFRGGRPHVGVRNGAVEIWQRCSFFSFSRDSS